MVHRASSNLVNVTLQYETLSRENGDANHLSVLASRFTWTTPCCRQKKGPGSDWHSTRTGRIGGIREQVVKSQEPRAEPPSDKIELAVGALAARLL